MKQATRSLNLPKPIAAYFIADEGDGEAVSQCFTENAVVKDEGHTHKGRAAIKAVEGRMPRQSINTHASLWRAKRRTERTVVTCHQELVVDISPAVPLDPSGTFFKLEGDKIASLEIIP
jgi:hypothetical protein